MSISNGEAGSSVRTKLNEALDTGSESVTTGASPVNADNTVRITHITSGGTAGNEDIVLPNFALDGNGVNAAKNGSIHVFVLDVQTDGGDSIRVFTGSAGANVQAADAAGSTVALIGDGSGVPLRWGGANATFVWQDTHWYFDNKAGDNSASYTSQQLYVNNNQVTFLSNVDAPPVNHPEGGNTVISERAYIKTNSGASALAVFNLPSISGADWPGDVRFSFDYLVTDSHGQKIVAAGTDTIRYEASESAPGGFVQSTVVGSFSRLVAAEEGKWYVIQETGTWTVDS